MTDRQLAISARAGDASAYAELAQRWSGPILAVCRRRLRCVHAAEDSVQEALLRGWKAVGTVHDPERFGAWILGIARRVCLDWHKRKQNGQTVFSSLEHRGVPVSVTAERESVLEQLEHTEDQQRLMAEVERLPADCREIILIYYAQDVTYAELSARLGIAVATVNQRLAKAKKLLRTRLAPPARCDS